MGAAWYCQIGRCYLLVCLAAAREFVPVLLVSLVCAQGYTLEAWNAGMERQFGRNCRNGETIWPFRIRSKLDVCYSKTYALKYITQFNEIGNMPLRFLSLLKYFIFFSFPSFPILFSCFSIFPRLKFLFCPCAIWNFGLSQMHQSQIRLN